MKVGVVIWGSKEDYVVQNFRVSKEICMGMETSLGLKIYSTRPQINVTTIRGLFLIFDNSFIPRKKE